MLGCFYFSCVYLCLVSDLNLKCFVLTVIGDEHVLAFNIHCTLLCEQGYVNLF